MYEWTQRAWEWWVRSWGDRVCSVCLKNSSISLPVFLRWGALWPVACAGCRRTWDGYFEALRRPRKSARYRTKHAAGALVLAGHLLRGQGTPHARCGV